MLNINIKNNIYLLYYLLVEKKIKNMENEELIWLKINSKITYISRICPNKHLPNSHWFEMLEQSTSLDSKGLGREAVKL